MRNACTNTATPSLAALTAASRLASTDDCGHCNAAGVPSGGPKHLARAPTPLPPPRARPRVAYVWNPNARLAAGPLSRTGPTGPSPPFLLGLGGPSTSLPGLPATGSQPRQLRQGPALYPLVFFLRRRHCDQCMGGRRGGGGREGGEGRGPGGRGGVGAGGGGRQHVRSASGYRADGGSPTARWRPARLGESVASPASLTDWSSARSTPPLPPAGLTTRAGPAAFLGGCEAEALLGYADPPPVPPGACGTARPLTSIFGRS